MSGTISFLPGQPLENLGPLARYLPPLPDGVAANWLRGHLLPGTWVLDPFGSSPRLAIEIARAGYRVLVAANNPVARCLLEMAAVPPAEAELRAALADLAAAHKGEERMEPHIRSLYITECDHCGGKVMADFFLWERGNPAPYARYYKCPHCDDEGERPATPLDHTRALQFGQSGLHRARALERVAPINDPDRAHAEEALEVYLPRAVYALFTLINKLDGLALSPKRLGLLHALLLYACDQANTLWSYPTERERPRQLTIPPRFREHNVWLALEQGIELWASPMADVETGGKDYQPVEVTVWPEMPVTGAGISLFEGRLKELAATLSQVEIGTVLAALPRPNQAFWTLSALWAGWLWGREGVGPFISVLRRRRYDWGWHTSALSSALRSLTPLLHVETPFLGLIGEAEPGFMSAAIIAAEEAGFELEGIALRSERGQAQIHWHKARPQGGHERATPPAPGGSSGVSSRSQMKDLIRQAGLDFLRKRGQPAHYLPLHCSGLTALAHAHAIQALGKVEEAQLPPPEPSPADMLSQVQASLKEAYSLRSGFSRFEGSEQSLEVGQWWLLEVEGAKPIEIPLADRVEMALVRLLISKPNCTFQELDSALCEIFPGLHTPDLELIHVCLDSYGEEQPTESGRWQLRPQEAPAARRADLETARSIVMKLGARLGFDVVGGAGAEEVDSGNKETSFPYLWKDMFGSVRYAFYVLASAALGEVVFGNEYPPELSFVIVPGGRANLVVFKLRTDPYLRQEIDKGWRFLKYRHIRQLMDNPSITPEMFNEQVDLDPLTYSMPQIRLL